MHKPCARQLHLPESILVIVNVSFNPTYSDVPLIVEANIRAKYVPGGRVFMLAW